MIWILTTVMDLATALMPPSLPADVASTANQVANLVVNEDNNVRETVPAVSVDEDDVRETVPDIESLVRDCVFDVTLDFR